GSGRDHRRDRRRRRAGLARARALRAPGRPARRHRLGARVGAPRRHAGHRRQGARDVPDRGNRRPAVRRPRGRATALVRAGAIGRRMAAFSIQELVRATEGALVSGDLGVAVSGVSIDSRTLQVGEAFFAIVGHRLNGHAFLGDAAARGAACVVVHALPDEPPAHVPLVLVEDTTRSLGRLAAWHRSKFSVPIVAITGSIGKTTAKELTAAVLATRWEVLKPASSFNNQWGLPLTLLRLGAEHGAAIVELGTNQAGEIAALSAIARPTVGVVTMVAAVHTEFLGTIEGVREEKAALVRALSPAGIAVLNADDPRVASMAREAKGRVVTFGRAALDTLAARRAGHRAVVVLGDMLELGALSDEAHREVGRAVAALPADELVGFGRAAALAVEAARAAGLAEAHHAPTFEDTVAHLLKRLTPGDVVLVKG